MSRTTHTQAPARLSALVLMGLLAALSAPTPARAEITEPERALLGMVPAGPTARGPVVAVVRASVSDGEAALLNNRRMAIQFASPSGLSAAEPQVDGARALLNGDPGSGQSRPSVASTSADTGE